METIFIVVLLCCLLGLLVPFRSYLITQKLEKYYHLMEVASIGPIARRRNLALEDEIIRYLKKNVQVEDTGNGQALVILSRKEVNGLAEYIVSYLDGLPHAQMWSTTDDTLRESLGCSAYGCRIANLFDWKLAKDRAEDLSIGGPLGPYALEPFLKDRTFLSFTIKDITEFARRKRVDRVVRIISNHGTTDWSISPIGRVYLIRSSFNRT